MVPQQTRCSRRVLKRLNQELERFGRHEECPEEVQLIAILRESAGVAAQAFDALGVDRAKLRRDLAAVVPPPRRFNIQESFARGLVTDTERELEESYPYEGTMHDLFMVLRDPDGRIAHVFAQHGITTEQVREAARRLADADGSSEGGTRSPDANRSIDQWIELFGSDDPPTRMHAGLQIQSWAITLPEADEEAQFDALAPRLVPLMLAALGDRQEEVRFAGAQTLGRFGARATRAVPVLTSLMHKGDLVAMTAAEAVWKITGDAAAVLPAITDVLRGDSQQRSFAWILLNNMLPSNLVVPADLVGVLVENLTRPDPIGSLQAAKALATLGPKATAALPALRDALANIKDTPATQSMGPFVFTAEQHVAALLSALFRISPDPVALLPKVNALLFNGTPQLTQGALAGLGWAGPAAAVALPQIEGLAVSSDPRIRVRAMAAHWMISREPKYAEALAKEQNSDDIQVQYDVLRVLHEMGHTTELPELDGFPSAEFDSEDSELVDEPADPLADELSLWDEAIRLDAADGQAFLLRGDVHVRSKDFDAAVADYREAMRLDASDPIPASRLSDALNDRAIAAKLRGEVEQAIADYTEAIALKPGSARPYSNRALAYFAQGNEEKGFADLEAAIAAEPDREVGWNNLAWHLATTADERFRDPVRAVHLARQSCTVTNYSDPVRLSTLAAAHAAKGEFAEAVKWIEETLERVPADDPQAREVHERHRRLYLSGTPVVGSG